jgi:hypothetical protein
VDEMKARPKFIITYAQIKFMKWVEKCTWKRKEDVLEELKV